MLRANDRIPACWYSMNEEEITMRERRHVEKVSKLQLVEKKHYCTACCSPVNPHKPKHQHYINGGDCKCRSFIEI